MKTCGSCQSILADIDRFCGDCGAAIPTAGAEATLASDDALLTAKTTEQKRKFFLTMVFASIGSGMIVLAGAALYFQVDKRDSSAIIRLSLNALAKLKADEKPDVPANPEPEQRAKEEEKIEDVDTQTKAEANGASEAPKDLQAVVERGSWAFVTELHDVSKVDVSDTSFQLDRKGIGSSESDTRCISQAVAKSPRASAFPFNARMGCSPTNFSMGDNRYQSTMTCNFPQYGGRRPIYVVGQYSGDSIALDVRVRVPAEIINGDFERPPEIYMHYRFTGHRIGAC